MTIQVHLQFVVGGPEVTGEWADDAVARRVWDDWTRLYGSSMNTVIRLVENTSGGERVLMIWERGRVVG